MAGDNLSKLVQLMARLRAPDGCPWDRAQDYDSVKGLLLEEAYEVVDTVNARDFDALEDELGDLLFQVVFYSRLAEEDGKFDIDAVIQNVHDKLVRRHPHVFGAARARDSAEVLKRWEELKAEERRAEGRPEHASLLDGVPKNLPALSEAFQLTRRASNVGFDWQSLEGVLEKLEEEAHELRREAQGLARARRGARRGRPAPPRANRKARARIEEEAGDLLFVAANIARFLGLDPEITLKKANRKFAGRFRSMELQAARRGGRLAGLSPEELERLWNRAKAYKRK